MLSTLIKKIRDRFHKDVTPRCLQCGLPPGRELMVQTEEPIMHPHRCTWCASVLYVPGPMFACKACAGVVREDEAA